MHDKLVSKSTVVTIALWVAACSLLTAAWGVMLFRPDGWRWAGMLSASGLMTCGGAVTHHMRCYVLQVLDLIRATAGLTSSKSGELHKIP